MTATDELRRLLDERGVAWDELQDCEGGKMTRWRDSMGCYVTAYDDGVVTFFADFYWQPTPQQAIDATLGRGACHVANASEYAWDDFECSECGWVTWGFIMEHEGCGTVAQPKFCPNCGREVVDA